MRILIISQYFYPENFKINEIAFFLKSKGYDITVLTSKPNYPEGKFFKGYNFFNKNDEIIEGVKIIRVPTFPRLKGDAISLSLNYFSFIFFSFFICLFKIRKKFDLIFATQLSPATSLLPMIWLKKRFNTPVILWVLDLWPDSFFANTTFRIRFIDNWITNVSNKIYQHSDSIFITSKYFKNQIKNRIKTKKRFTFFPNWAESVFYGNNNHDCSDLFEYPAGFNIVFAGNIGESQGFEDIVEAAKSTQNKCINWIIIGDGRKKIWLENQLKNFKINNLYLPGSFPINSMPYFFSKADCLLITLKKDNVFSNTLPGKFQPYLTSGKPILGNLAGEGLELIQNHKIGLACEPGNPRLLSDLAFKLSTMHKKELDKIKKNCINLNNTIFNKEMIFKSLLNELKLYDI